MGEHAARQAPAVAMRQCVVVFAKLQRYFLDRYADCLKRVAGIAMREVPRATVGPSASTAAAGRSAGIVVCAPLWRDAERTLEVAFVHTQPAGFAGAAGAGVSQGAGCLAARRLG